MSLGGEDGRAGGTERRRAGLAGYFLAATFARLGARTASMAILLLALERTDSAVVAGIVGGAMAVPSLALAPAVGTLIDRSPSPRVYFSLGFALFGGSILLVDLALTPTTWPFAVAAAAMSGVAMPLIEGAMSPLVARVTTEATLPRGYAVDVATYNTSSIFGAVVASAVTAAWGASAAMSVAAGMPVVAIAALLLVPMSRRGSCSSPASRSFGAALWQRRCRRWARTPHFRSCWRSCSSTRGVPRARWVCSCRSMQREAWPAASS